MSSTANSESDVVVQTADSKSASQDDWIVELKAPTAASHKSRKTKKKKKKKMIKKQKKEMTEEEKKEEEKREEEKREEEKKEEEKRIKKMLKKQRQKEKKEEAKKEEEKNSKKKKKRKRKKKEYYPREGCECCAKLATKKFVPLPDDKDYDHPNDDGSSGDKGLRLRMIHYRKSLAKSGGFEIECPPMGIIGGIYNTAHYSHPRLKETIDLSLQHAINTYNRVKVKQLELVELKHTTLSNGAYIVYYMTFEGLDRENDTTETYQAVVSYSFLEKRVRRVLVFRRKSNGEDLLKPYGNFGELTRPWVIEPRVIKPWLKYG